MGDYVKVRRVANQNVSNSTWTSVSWDTEDSDTAGYFSSGAPTRITVPTGKAGKFAFSFRYNFDATQTGRSFQQFTVFNSSGVAQKSARAPMGYALAWTTITSIFDLADGDYVVTDVWQSSGGTRVLSNGRLEVMRLSTVTDFVQVRRTSVLAVNSATYTSIPFEVEDADLGGFWASGNPTQIVVPAGKGGDFFFTLSYTLNGTVNNQAFMEILNNGSGDFTVPTGRGNEDKSAVTGVTRLADGQTLQPRFYHEGGVDLASADFKLVRME